MKNIIIFIIITVLVVIGGVYIYTFHRDLFPNTAERVFIQTCKDLNGKEFTEQNIQSMKGICFVDWGIKQCTSDVIVKATEAMDRGNPPVFIIHQRESLDDTWECIITKRTPTIISEVKYYSD